MSGNLGTIYYEVDARTGKLLIAQQQAEEAFDRIERGARKADSGVKKLNTQMTKTSAAVKTNLSPATGRRLVTALSIDWLSRPKRED